MIAKIAAAAFLCVGLLPAAGADDWFSRSVKSVEATFDPAEAKPGQTVTLRLTVHLNDGYHTYPLKQPEKAAENFTNALRFPDPGAVIFVGEPADPADPATKPEPLLGIKALRTHAGSVTYTRKAVVSPKAAAGPAAVTLPGFTLQVCDEKTCFPPKKLTPEATLKVLAGPAVPVDKAYQDEVTKALGGK